MPTDRERIAAAYAAWNRGDLDGWLAVMDPDVRLDAPGIFPGFDPEYRGHDGLTRFWGQLRDPWEEFGIEVERLDEVAEGWVVAIRFRATGAGSGVDVDMQFGHGIRIRDGLATEIIARGSAEEARAALRG